MAGLAAALQDALHDDLLDGFEQLIHGELFSDFLDMAEHLLEKKFNVAAAVVAGCSLESHIRQLCIKNGLPVTEQKNGKTVHIRAAKMNDDLRAANVYDANQNKIISSFLGTRNDAAHPTKKEITEGTVQAMTVGIRAFMVDYPA